MTLIAAFRCEDGVVICADSQETLGIPLPANQYAEYRVSVDKIEPREIGHYELVIGGAGHGSLVEGFTEALEDQIETWDAGLDAGAIKTKLRAVAMDYHRHEVAVYPAEDKEIQFLVCLKQRRDPNAEIHLWEMRGSTLRRVKDYSLIGWEEAIYKHDIQRHYQASAKTLYSMLLGVHVLLLAKKTSNNVGGDTRIVVATRDGLRCIAQSNVAELNQRVELFDRLLDELRLQLSDTSISPDSFEDGLDRFKKITVELHLHYLTHVIQTNLERLKADPNAPDDPYLSLPPFEELLDSTRVSEQIEISSHAYAITETIADLAVSTRAVIKAARESYEEGLLTLEQKDRIADLLVGIAKGGKQGAELLESLHTLGIVLVGSQKSAQISKIFADEVISRYVQLESEIANLSSEARAKIRLPMENVRASLLLASKRRLLASNQPSKFKTSTDRQ